MIVCIPSEDGSIRDFCIRSYLLILYSLNWQPWRHLEMQNEISEQNGPRDMVSFSFEWFFKFVQNDHKGCCTLPKEPNRTRYFEAQPSVVHLLYNGEITLACRVKHLEPFSPNGLFVHLLYLRQTSFKNDSVFIAKIALLEIYAHVAICCFCTAKIDYLEDTLRCKTKYLDRMDP